MKQRKRDHGQLRMFILDVMTHDDLESLESILKLLNNPGCIGWCDFWPEPFTADEVLSQLRILVDAGHLHALREDDQASELVTIQPDDLSDDDLVWFSLTNSGRRAWEEWEPPGAGGPSASTENGNDSSAAAEAREAQADRLAPPDRKPLGDNGSASAPKQDAKPEPPTDGSPAE